MIERTEDAALARVLPLIVGGARVTLRTLVIDESEDWLQKLGQTVGSFDIPSGSGPEVLAALAQVPSKSMLALVVAYDVEGKLGDEADLRKVATQREMYSALKQMLWAEAPLVEDARSAAEAFGPQLREFVQLLMASGIARLQSASSMNGHSETSALAEVGRGSKPTGRKSSS